MVEHSDIVELDQGLLKAWPIFNVLNSLRFGWLVYAGFLKCEIPPKTHGIQYYFMVTYDLDDLRVSP